MFLSELISADVLVLGGSTAAMICALSHAAAGKKVVLLTAATHLYTDLFSAGDLRPVMCEQKLWKDLLFPDRVLSADGYIHPDRLKLHGESLMKERGIDLLYACQAIGFADGAAIIAHKAGLFALPCAEAFDLREQAVPSDPVYLLHVLREGRLALLPVSGINADTSPQARYERYDSALRHLPRGAVLARGGTSAASAAGHDVSHAITAGLNAPRMMPGVKQWDRTLQESKSTGTGREMPLPEPEIHACDVMIVGGGTAGASAALFCARQGLRTVLLEMNDQLGGTSTIGGVNTYWFGLRAGATAIIDKAVRDCRERCHQPARRGLWNDDDHFLPDLKAHVLLGLCLEAGVDVRFNSIACGVCREDQRVTGIYYAQHGKPRYGSAGMVIDCTGDGDVCVLAGADSTYGSERDGMTYWASLAQYPSPDRYRNNFSTMVNVGDPLDYTRFILAGRMLCKGMYDHGRYVAVRESRHIHGLETVTLEAILRMDAVRDPLYTCFSNYDPKGRLTADLCYFGMLPPNQQVRIPRGAVIPADRNACPIEGLLIGGKAISCTHDAFPGIRMQSDLQAQGLALAALAGCALEQQTAPWSATGVAERIRLLGGDVPDDAPAACMTLSDAVGSLTAATPWEWLDAPVTGCETSVNPVIRIMLADTAEAVPLLKTRYRSCDDPGLRLVLSRLLLWHHDGLGVHDVLHAINNSLASTEGLPRRTGSVNYGQMLPDHGLMPECVYLVNSLANAPETDVSALIGCIVQRLGAMERNWYDLRAGIYCWCESVAWIAVRRMDRRLIPALCSVLALPELQREAADPLLSERLHMLRLTLLHALHTLGCREGTDGLLAYRNEKRAVLRMAAEKLLA